MANREHKGTYYQGEAVGARIETESWAPATDAYADANPSNGVLITITNPSGTDLVTENAMTNEATGVYSFRYQLSASAPLGIYKVVMRADDTYDKIAVRTFRVIAV